MTPDVNVLVAAFRSDHSHHAAARAWLLGARQECSEGADTLVLLPMVVASFLRLVTNARVFPSPDSAEDAIAFIDVLAESPGVEILTCGNEWPHFRSLVLTGRLNGNLVTDAWIAAAVMNASEHLVTFDRDYVRLLPSRDFTLLPIDFS